jgi:beta-galactosidase
MRNSNLFPKNYPGKKFLGTETTSALATRGHYDMPSDSIRRWPVRWDIPFNEGNPDNTVSAYDNVSAPWGSTHEESWKIIKKHEYLSGMYIWTGFDYLASLHHTVGLHAAHFSALSTSQVFEDCYYMNQSEWTILLYCTYFRTWN